jgi:hypothetical protein
MRTEGTFRDCPSASGDQSTVIDPVGGNAHLREIGHQVREQYLLGQ